jgi:hypothetical protein
MNGVHIRQIIFSILRNHNAYFYIPAQLNKLQPRVNVVKSASIVCWGGTFHKVGVLRAKIFLYVYCTNATICH